MSNLGNKEAIAKNLLYPNKQLQQRKFNRTIKLKERGTMKTVGQVITYLEMELTDAWEMHDEYKGKDKQQALFYLIKATTILELLEVSRNKKRRG